MENQNSEIYEDEDIEVSAEESHEHPQEETLEDVRPEPEFDVLCAALDGLLLIHNKPLPLQKLAELLGVSIEKTQEVIELKKAAYEQDINSGLQIVVLENGVQLATKARVSEFIQRLDGQKLVSLSLPALETLSVIAFKQPITKAEIDAIRGVNCDGVVSTLLEKKLIYVSGEKAVLGRPRLYSTTQDFLYYFGMQSLKELPLPSIDIPDQLTPEGQKAEKQQEAKESEKEFDESQGLLSIEEETAKKDGEAETVSDSEYPSDQADGDKT
jgi:segregation and condensation protein B